MLDCGARMLLVKSEDVSVCVCDDLDVEDEGLISPQPGGGPVAPRLERLGQ